MPIHELKEQIGRLPGGEQAAVVRATARVRIGTGTTGPAAALWVADTVLDEAAADDRAQEPVSFTHLTLPTPARV